MNCPNCGTNIENGTICPACGAQAEENAAAESEFMEVTQAPDSKTEGDTKKKKKKALTPEEQVARKKLIKKLIVAGAFWLVAINMISFAIIIGVLAINNPAHTVIRQLEDGSFYSAASTFEYDMKGKANKKLIEGLDERLDEIWEEYQKGSYYDYDDIETELETIKDMNIPEISEKLTTTITSVETLKASRDAFEDGQREENYDDYMEAITYYSRVISSDANYEAAQARIKELTPLYRTEIIQKIDEYIEYGYYTSAFEELATLKKALPEDAEVEKKAAEYEKLISTKADEYTAQLLYDEAESLIGIALEGDPENEALKAKLEELQNNRPVMLSELVVTDKSRSYNTDTYTFEDANGIEHRGRFMLDPGNDPDKLSVVEVELKGDYTKFAANFVPEKGTNVKEKFTIEILVDGKSAKTIKSFTAKSKNEAVEIDVTDAQKLTIRVKSSDSSYYSFISMTEACLYK